MKRKHYTFDYINIIIMILFIFFFLFPFWMVLVISFSTQEAYAHGYHFFPRSFTIEEYIRVFENGAIPRALVVSGFITIVGTALSLLLTIPCAYALSKTRFFCKKVFSAITVFPMLFSGGLIPFFLVVSGLGLSNTLWALIIPMAVSPFNLIIAKSFMTTIEVSLEESARLDGANDIQIFIQIVAPLCKPLITAMGMFYAIGYYNEYLMPILFIHSRSLYPVQLVLREMVINNVTLGPIASARAAVGNIEMFQMASVIVGIIPILLVFPFAQKYFVSGVMLGAVKE